MSAPDSPVENGLWNSAKRVLDTCLATAQNRIELFAVELREEKCHLIEALLLVAALSALGLMTLTLATLTIVLVFWETARLGTLITLTIVYLAGTIWAGRALRKRLDRDSPFSGTTGELKKDRACFDSQN